MDVRTLHGKQLLAAVVFIAATLVLAVQLITPTPVVISVGTAGTDVAELTGYFRYHDAAVIALSGTLLGGSGTYLVTSDWSQSETTATAAERPASTQAGESIRADGAAEHAPTDELLEARRQEWEDTTTRLANNERAIYETILEADGVLAQSDIVEQTDLSKATVSRGLDSLETKNLVERKRRGMGNMVFLL